MAYISSKFSRFLIVLGMLMFCAAPLKADPMVIFTSGGTGPLNILNLQQFIVGTTDNNGNLTVVLRNATNLTFLDFHFETEGIQSARWIGNGLPFFGNFTSTSRRIDFVTGGTGVGIPPSMPPLNPTFTVTFSGFVPNTIVRGTATVPEPTTLLLLGTGLAGIVFKVRKRLKRKTSNGEEG